ncbi:hypothetical protein N180_02915 [Pedobacter antarcticus 4BY]|uniref:Uncharacterized protein n=1 Tax=Pedobacter antarcticus 4BY TaxID=1358423 RepID=A0A081PKJ3_9SPHI|nr:hypothetical protein N180_02915 [Pedobacter antarcticus 4BY]
MGDQECLRGLEKLVTICLIVLAVFMISTLWYHKHLNEMEKQQTKEVESFINHSEIPQNYNRLISLL